MVSRQAIAPFLALSCGKLLTIDLRYFEGDLSSTLAELQPDLVTLLYSASSFRLENLFEFGL